MLLTSLVLLPLVGALACWLAGRSAPRSARVVAVAAAVAEAGLVTLALVVASRSGSGGLTVALTGGGWPLRLDGLAGPLTALTALLGVVAPLASWRVRKRPGAHFAMLLVLQAAVTAVFLAADLVVFYVAWEAVLVPMFFLIGIWGHEKRRHAAMKFFIYTFAGSALMLVGLIVVIASTGTTSMAQAVATGLDARTGTLVFWLLAIGFAVKIPIWPLHTWLPDAHVEAPTAGSIMLAGVLLKMGGYGFIRLALPLAPAAARAAAPVLATLGIIAIVYGALMALAQTDLKRLVAYSSVAHMGFVVLAIAIGSKVAIAAAVLVMVAHGLTSALLFLLVGLLDDRAHTREISRFGGLLRVIPGWGTALTFGLLASLGLPGLAGFPGELLSTLEGFRAYGWWMAVVALGVVLAGAYNLRALRRVAHGPLAEEWREMRDLDLREVLAIVPLAAGILALGVWPGLVSSAVSPVATAVAKMLGGG
jgi:NADH-quinone oxidoreductase subunit M